ncbi:MAG: YtxH domain-containing protein [bacterium]|nr:YtxH domain-containing protein [bacterium]
MKNSTAGATLLGAAVASLAAYFFFGPKGKENRKHTKEWANKMKDDVLRKIEKTRDLTEPMYREIVDSIAATYEKGKDASRAEIRELASDLKKHWKSIKNSAQEVKHDAIKGAGRVAKKVRG